MPGEQEKETRAQDSGKRLIKDAGRNWRLTQSDYIAIAYCRGILAIVDENSEKSV